MLYPDLSASMKRIASSVRLQVQAKAKGPGLSFQMDLRV